MNSEYFYKRGYYQGVCDSFTSIRKANRVESYSCSVNKDSSRGNFLTYCTRKVVKVYRSIVEMVDKVLPNNDWRTYQQIQKRYQEGYHEGYQFHQVTAKNSVIVRRGCLGNNC